MKLPDDAQQLRQIFSSNLTGLMNQSGKTVADIAADLNVPYTTAASWAKGEKYPRMDKVQALADYFGVTKSELIEAPGEGGPDDELREVLEFYKNRPDMKLLFSTTRHARPENVIRAARIVEALEKEERGDKQTDE